MAFNINEFIELTKEVIFDECEVPDKNRIIELIEEEVWRVCVCNDDCWDIAKEVVKGKDWQELTLECGLDYFASIEQLAYNALLIYMHNRINISEWVKELEDRLE